MSDATQRAAIAERAARAGGVVARQQFRGALAVETKADKNDLVTETDHESQRQVIATIRQEYPDATFVCEEESTPAGVDPAQIDLREQVPESGRAWVIDPIDGTSNFVRGMRFWGTSVAAVAGGEPVGVATFLPAIDDLYAAGPESVSLNGSTMAVSDRTDPETFAVGLIGWWPARQGDQHVSLFRAATERFGDVRRLGCMQGVLALVAAGSLEAAFMPKTGYPWDTLAGVHLIRRAGGTVTDVHGERWTSDAEGLVASNGECHSEVLAAVEQGIGVEAAD